MLSWLLLVSAWVCGVAGAQQRVATPQVPRQIADGSAVLTGPYDPEQKLRLTFSLRPPHLQEEEQLLRELQDKNSPQFHKYLTEAQWNTRFAPSVADEQAVVDWAASQGLTITQRYSNRLIVDAEAPAGLIGSALGVQINHYQIAGETFFSNDRAPSIPAQLAGILLAVHGLNNVQHMHSHLTNSKNDPGPEYSPGPMYSVGSHLRSNGKPSSWNRTSSAKNADVHTGFSFGGKDPGDIYSSFAYDFQALSVLGRCCNPLGNPNNSPPESSIAIVIWGDFADSDVNGFFGTYYLASNVQRYFVDGTPTCCNIEATLDIEWATATANSFGTSANTAEVNVYEGVNSNHSTLIDTLNRALTDGHARVVNMSWGAAENYEVTSAQMDSYHAVFNQMVGQGWTLVAASGDGGATTDCANHLSVSYPGSDPDVTSAGGTSLTATSFYYYFETGWSGGWGGCAQNDGGGGGGCSAYYGMPDYQGVYPACGTTSRSVPDLALNADGDYNPQVLYFQGSWQLVGGTSVGSPELAGFFAQENAYLLSIQGLVGNTCGPSFSAACAPMGNANYYIYDEGFHHHAPHFPFYDIMSGCNGNDITQQFGLTPFCATPSYDLVTGWGSANMLQFAWAINNSLAGDASAPSATFSGPEINHWFNTDQTISWTIADTTANGHRPDGVSGFAYAWDQDPGDTYSEATPGGNWSTFYTGPPYPNGTSGAVALSTANIYVAGCHTLYVRTWDNAGQSGPSTYGPVCYDIYPPYTTPIFYGNELNGTFIGPVLTALQAQDSGSGVASTTYRVDGGRWQSYVLPFSIAVPGTHVLNFYSTDVAGNVETVEQASFTISSNFDSTLTVTKPGSGSGTVTTGDGDIYCGDICSHVYYDGTPITLTATPSTGSVLTGWSGCDSVTGATCTVTVNADQTVLAIFSPATALRFVPITPCRVADTRLAVGPFGGPSINGGDYRDYVISDGPCGKFPHAAAYSLNVAVVPHGVLHYLTTWPSELDRPLVATMNSLDGRIKANAAIVPVGANNAISVYVTDTTDVILDVNGYFVPETSDPNGLQFYPVTPCRIVDTRQATGTFGGPSLAAKQVRDFPLLQNTTCIIPPAAQAYSLNFTVVPPGPMSYLTVWPADQQQPVVSTLNDLTGTVVANAAILPGAKTSSQTVNVGDIDVYVTHNTDLVIDINGYFAPANSGGQSLYAVAPCRALDTRLTTGLFTNLLAPPVNVVNSPCGVPATAQSVVFNATVVPSGLLRFLTLWPDGATQPLVSTLNAFDGAVTSNMAIVPMTDGSVDAFASGYTQLIMDIFGYFAPE